MFTPTQHRHISVASSAPRRELDIAAAAADKDSGRGIRARHSHPPSTGSSLGIAAVVHTHRPRHHLSSPYTAAPEGGSEPVGACHRHPSSTRRRCNLRSESAAHLSCLAQCLDPGLPLVSLGLGGGGTAAVVVVAVRRAVGLTTHVVVVVVVAAAADGVAIARVGGTKNPLGYLDVEEDCLSGLTEVVAVAVVADSQRESNRSVSDLDLASRPAVLLRREGCKDTEAPSVAAAGGWKAASSALVAPSHALKEAVLLLLLLHRSNSADDVGVADWVSYQPSPR